MFKVQDLMISVLARDGSGGVMMPTPTEPTPPSPISPVAAVAALSPQLVAIDKVVQYADKVDLHYLDDIALEIGRAVVAARAVALCTEDMATCDGNPRISPVASSGLGFLQRSDFAILREHVLQAAEWVHTQEEVLERRGVEHAKELLPRLKEAAEYLGERGG